MKQLLTILSIILFASCTKTNYETVKHGMGALPDKQSDIDKTPVIYSQDYFKVQLEKGKPPKKDTTVVVIPPSTKDVTPPTVYISQPLSNTNFHIGDNVTIKAQALDASGVSKIYFYLDGKPMDSSTNYQPTFIWNTTSSNTGTHTITVKAKDAYNNIGSAYVIITLDVSVIPITILPSSILLECPPVGDQGVEGSCVGWSVSIARSIEWHYKSGLPYSNATISSPEYLYDNIKFGNCGSGSAVITAEDFLVSSGIVTWQTLPYSDQNGCDIIPTQSQINEALNYRIKSYSTVLGSDDKAIKTMLVNHHPLTFTFGVDQNFYNATNGYIYSSKQSAILGSHAITLVGYDDTKNTYTIINEWGTGWGTNGYLPIDQTFFKTIVFQLFVQNIN